jgi:hypothetical protein
MYEMVESLHIVNQVVKKCSSTINYTQNKSFDSYNILAYVTQEDLNKKVYNHNITMENTINEFKY